MASDQDTLVAKSRLRTRLFGEPPQTIGRYAIVDKVGSGAMGAVYRARDPKLGRDVAVKVLLPGTESTESSQRFVREAQALARLTHPNVVQVFEVGSADPQRFIAMEYVPGRTLDDWLEVEDRSVGAILDVFDALARGLHAAHQAGVLHRDFKPSNVLVGTDGRPRITDFGLAAADEPAHILTLPESTTSVDRLSESLTRDGSIVGTPAYMSPEQFQTLDLDARSDQFSFCVALFEALYGRRPFRARSVPELCRLVLAGRIRRPPGVEIPERIDAVLTRGLSVEREDRYDSMLDLARALADARRTRGRRWPRLAAVVGVAAVGLGALALWPQRTCEAEAAEWNNAARKSVENGIREAALDDASGRAAWASSQLDDFFAAWEAQRDAACKAAEADPDTPHLDGRFACLRRHRASAQSAINTLRSGKPDEARLGLATLARLADPTVCEHAATGAPPPDVADAVASARIDLERAASLDTEQRFAAARTAADALVERAEEIGYAPLLAEALLLQGAVASRDSSRGDAGPILERAYQLAVEIDDPGFALRAAAHLASTQGVEKRRRNDADRWLRTARSLGERAPAEVWRIDVAEARVKRARREMEASVALTRKALAAVRQRRGEGHVSVIVLRTNLAMGLVSNNMVDAAEVEVEDLFRGLTPAFGPRHPVLADAYYVRAKVALERGDHQAAVQAMRDSVRSGVRGDRLTLHGADRLQGLGAVLGQAGQYEEAREHLERVLALYEETLASDDPRTGLLLGNLALTCEYLGDHEQARVYAERAVVVAEVGNSDALLATALSQLTDVLLTAGETEAVVTTARRALLLEGSSPGRRLALQQNLALALGRLGLHEEALAELAAASKAARASMGAHPRTAALLANQGDMLAKLGRYDEAHALVQEAAEMMESTKGADSYEVSRVLYVMAFVEHKRGNLAAAERVARRVLAVRQDAGQDPLELAAAHVSLARVLGERRRSLPQAREQAEIARRIYAEEGASDKLAELEEFLR